jgi:hypothetical protein
MCVTIYNANVVLVPNRMGVDTYQNKMQPNHSSVILVFGNLTICIMTCIMYVYMYKFNLFFLPADGM